MDFMEFEHDFHGHVGPCRMCRLSSDIDLVVYIYVYIYVCAAQLIFVMQVAVVASVCLFICLFLLLVENELNLLMSYNFDLKFDKPLKYLTATITTITYPEFNSTPILL